MSIIATQNFKNYLKPSIDPIELPFSLPSPHLPSPLLLSLET